jgi:hypothetical protein
LKYDSETMDLTIHKFANLVTVLAKETEDLNKFVVYWKSGVNRQGKVMVDIQVNVGDKKAVAELTAMQHIIDELEVLGWAPPLKGLKLVFSVPAIKKIHLQTSKKRHLYDYSYFLTTRFTEATVDHEQDDSWLKPRAEQYVTEIAVDGPPGEWIYVNQIGKVTVTRHAIEQFGKRMNNLEPLEAWRALSKLLRDARPVKVDVSDDRKDADKVVHASEGTRWMDTLTKWRFVIATNKHGQPTITTTYYK